MLGPDNFGFGDEIRAALRNWIDIWQDNFADFPFEHPHTWRHGFDVGAWIGEGDRISLMIEEALPGYRVERLYRSYSTDPVRPAE